MAWREFFVFGKMIDKTWAIYENMLKGYESIENSSALHQT